MRRNSKRNCDGIIDQKGNGNRDKLSWKGEGEGEGEGEGDAWWAKGKAKGGKRMRVEKGKGKLKEKGIYEELIDWICWFGNDKWLYVPIINTSYLIDLCITLQTEMLFR